MVTASFCPVDKALDEKRKDAGVTLQLLARKENHSELYFTFPEDKWRGVRGHTLIHSHPVSMVLCVSHGNKKPQLCRKYPREV